MKYFSIIGIFLFVFILSKSDIIKIIETLVNANPLYISLSFILLGLSLYVRALKWKVLVNFLKKDYSIWQALKTYIIGIAFGLVTPGKAGDLIKVFDLKKVINMDAKQGISLTIFDKIIDTIILFGIGLISVIIIAYRFSTRINLSLIIASLIFFLLALIFLLTKRAGYLLGPLFKIFVPDMLKEKIKNIYHAFLIVIETARKNKNFIYYIFLALISWLPLFLMQYIFSLAIGLRISVLYFLLFMPIVFSVGTLPITLLGIGTRDAALILLFSLINISKESMISISLMMLVFGNLPIVLIGFLFTWKQKYEIAQKI